VRNGIVYWVGVFRVISDRCILFNVVAATTFVLFHLYPSWSPGNQLIPKNLTELLVSLQGHWVLRHGAPSRPLTQALSADFLELFDVFKFVPGWF
jgi:hypothetical protein